MILSGELQSGSQIREEALAELCGVSRTPVRDALRRLEAEMFVRRNESQRSFVADWSLDDLEDAFQLRAMLEAHAAKRAAARITKDQLVRMRGLNAQLKIAIDGDRPDVPRFLDCNRLLHMTIVEAAASERLAGMLMQVTEQPVVLRTAQQYDLENLRRSHHEHDELLIAFDNCDGEWAAAVMTAHIRRAFHAYAEAHSTSTEIRKSNLAA
jgi:DNA-binding GntR family transcriptional regulator